jgi:hypothetical protein
MDVNIYSVTYSYLPLLPPPPQALPAMQRIISYCIPCTENSCTVLFDLAVISFCFLFKRLQLETWYQQPGPRVLALARGPIGRKKKLEYNMKCVKREMFWTEVGCSRFEVQRCLCVFRSAGTQRSVYWYMDISVLEESAASVFVVF